MSQLPLILLSVVTFLSLLAAAVLSYLKIKADDKAKMLEARLLKTESKQHEVVQKRNESANFAAENAERKSLKVSLQQQEERRSEVLNFRKEISALKDELKRVKLSAVSSEKESRLKLEKLEMIVDPLKLENEQMRQALNSRKTQVIKSQVPQQSLELTTQQAENAKIEVLNAQLRDFEKLKSEFERLKVENMKLKAEVKFELEKKKAEAFKLGRENKKWKERALEGRKMYQLMKQLRNMSDEKIQSYQDIVVKLSSGIVDKAVVTKAENAGDIDLLIPAVISALEIKSSSISSTK